METPPRAQTRSSSKRIPTPQISERKKRLFKNKSDDPIKKLPETSLDGIRPLTPDLSNNLKEINLNRSVNIMLKKKSTKKLSFLKDNSSIDINMFTKCSDSKEKTPIRRSPRSSTKKINNADTEMSSPKHERSLINATVTSENKITSPKTPKNKRNCTDELGKLFKNSLNFKNDKNKSRKEIDSDESFQMSSTDIESDEEIEETPCKILASAKKRARLGEINDENRKCKIIKVDENQNKSIDDIKISTKSFYSNKENISINKHKYSPPSKRKNISIKKRKSKYVSKAEMKLFNRGVRHKIRKPLKPKKSSIDDMLKTIHCEKFKFLPSKRLSKEKVDLVHKILAENKNPIEMAKPLNINPTEEANLDFSDIENSSDSDDNDNKNKSSEKLSDDEEKNLNKNKKFFKSARNSTTKKEITITNQIKATYLNGKIALKTKKPKKKKSKIKVQNDSFSAEQFQVNEIIANLNDSPIKKMNSEEVNSQSENENNSLSNNTSGDLEKTKDYSEFLNRLPYNTTDPALIKQQRLLLGFLITNDICNEKNFNIFIADPDNHKEEANQICNNLVCIADNTETETIEKEYDDYAVDDGYEEFRKRIPYETDSPVIMQEQHMLLDYLIEHDICTEENFVIFIAEADEHQEKAAQIMNDLNYKYKTYDNSFSDSSTEIETEGKPKLFPIFYGGTKFQQIPIKTTRHKQKSRLLYGAMGSNQYQIDAGQKDYGAKQCPQCGLVYTVHEPEEEILHKEYHNSMYILKFRNWVDEDVVADYPEWGYEGRIIRIKTMYSNKQKRRLMDVLKVVDKELGFSSYILPSHYVAFLAIRLEQIVGLCLVQFHVTANKFVDINGLDCCTEETFPAGCGISRIWVSPFHRRLRIASKLILAVQTHAIEDILIDKESIAFSSPTEDGKIFARNITGLHDFLVYQ